MHTTFNAFILAANFIQMYHVDVLFSRPMKIIFIFMPLRVLTFRPHPSFFIFIASWPSYSVIARHSFLLCPVLIARVDQTLEMTEKTASYYASTTVRVRPPPSSQSLAGRGAGGRAVPVRYCLKCFGGTQCEAHSRDRSSREMREGLWFYPVDSKIIIIQN